MATCAFRSRTKRSSDGGDTRLVRGSPAFDGGQRRRRGRSVSRPPNSREGASSSATSSSSSSSRRRSASVARYRCSDSENEEPSDSGHVKSYGSWNYGKPSVTTPVSLNHNHQVILKRSSSQIELSKSCDGDSSHSSALTDEEPRDSYSNKNGRERITRAVYPQKKIENPINDGVATELYEVMRKELRHAVDDIRTEIEQGMLNANQSVLDDDTLQSTNSDVLQAVSVIRKNYTAKLEQSEKRKQDLLAAIVAEEQRGRELSKIVKELLPDPKNTSGQEKSSLGRQNNDRSWTSKCLSEDAEKYFDDFLSNVEDTDISSFDGERSDASSSIGVKKPRDIVLHFEERETAGLSARSGSLPVEMDGVVLPWLQWETSNDSSSQSCKSKVDVPLIPGENLYSSAQGESHGGNSSKSCASSRLKVGNHSVFPEDDTKGRFDGSNGLVKSPITVLRKTDFNMDQYLHLGGSEEVIFEAWRQQQKISCGALILCSRSFLEL